MSSIGLVIVSHSARLAEGVRELVEQVVQGDVAIAVAGGTALADAAIGTDPAKVAAAIESLLGRPEVSDVLVLMDLGSAIMSAEAAFELLPEAMRSRVHLCEAPLVEGALAAAMRARIGGSLAEVYAEARKALTPKIEQLAGWQHLLPPLVPVAKVAPEQVEEEAVELTIVVPNQLGLHARPAARLVTLVAQYDAQVTITHHGRTVPATSLNQLVTLGVRQHDVLVVRASGPEAEAAIAAIEALALDNLGDPIEVTEPTEIIAAAVSEEDHFVVGVPASEGVAVGPAVPLRAPTIEPEEAVATDPDQERLRLREAIAAVTEQLRTLRGETGRRIGAAEAGIFDAQILMINDRELIDTAEEAIELRRLNAASAWNLALRAVVARYRALNDPYLARRAEDVLDAGQRVLRHLLGVPADTLLFDSPEPAILVAIDLKPSDVARLPADRVLGILTAEGGPTSHSAILARSLGIPAVTGVGAAALTIADGQIVGLDGATGHVWLAPDAETIEELDKRRRRWLAERSEARKRAQAPARLRSGEPIEILANMNLPGELETALLNGAEGVGLFRTEFLYFDREAPPSEEEQLDVYQDAARRLKGKPLIIRTLDVGGDKPLPYLRQPREPNPFLGRRGLRYCLEHPGLFRPQMRAILRAAADHPIRVMFPMVSHWEELVMVDALIDEICAELQAEGLTFDEDLQRGVMIETPSAVLIADQLARLVDFFSIGTNDLAQYIMAADRDNAAVAHLVNPLQPAVLRAIRETVKAGHANGIKVSLCGEMAGDPKATALLIGLGIDALSMTPTAIPIVKERIRHLELAEARRVAAMALEMSSAEEVEAYLAEMEEIDAAKMESKS